MTAPRIIRPEIRSVIQQPLTVGESPVWDDETGTLWLVDILAPAVVRLSASGQIDRFDMPAAIGSLGLCRDNRIVVGLQTGVHLFDPVSGKIEFLCDPVGRDINGRLNDGKVGPDGHFWVGSISEAKPQVNDAALFRVGADGSTRTVATGLTSSNGLAWSPDGRRMYHSDSRQCFLQAFDFYPETGSLGKGRRLRSFTEDEGRPDGATTDRDGLYWSAGVSAGRVNRISREGEIVEIYILPVAAPTMPCFGGPDLSTLFVTSLSTDRTGRFEAGTVIAFDVDAEGLPPFRFGNQSS
ncbi:MULTISPECIES: SMP-30/gluconolactonase/LRE family protein [unclassified Rhizobium]|uniref:SMP-30/gluconolactonase/LRE family protein n=1 Tax=unclassified Rhizobium TaxID=2613769 RepID=UPI001A9950A1|nr:MULTISPECIES: SMP-30/gluconolactonase/LRE family protein [unclassified Rhizobium]MBX5156797.1 SMP-30/gluconolactonase/LRE family protein [Rhizobium sp. NZLR8]MBX5166375.1 SMP-30/gluconolactonase/LRE family protein [Rhizobium sp. NZLR4b]MBX5168516.1 SMP-30/gluconolactonase/LRE family protein [Rhizobium sp. NZLR1b]MBX5194162.1 SMP-30/gluconolactonase/LRE family protein [Rhizobium sp. NZLR10]MBX5199957.1 SMP-30/gluconolactonase/LRE family protein [Rhizobium sp. NZLR1]